MCNYLTFGDCSAFIFFVCLSAVFLLLFRLLFFAVCGCAAVFFAEIRLFEGKKSVLAQQQNVEKWCQNNRMNLAMEPKRETYICIYVYIYMNSTKCIHEKIKLRSSIDCSWWSTKCGQPLVTMTVVRQHDRANRGRHGAERGRHGAEFLVYERDTEFLVEDLQPLPSLVPWWRRSQCTGTWKAIDMKMLRFGSVPCWWLKESQFNMLGVMNGKPCNNRKKNAALSSKTVIRLPRC